jgi:hypothetical protein
MADPKQDGSDLWSNLADALSDETVTKEELSQAVDDVAEGLHVISKAAADWKVAAAFALASTIVGGAARGIRK